MLPLRIQLRLTLAAALGLFALRAGAQSVTVGINGAGQTLGNYLVLSGSGPLTTINGTLGTQQAHLFEINIDTPATFSVTTATTPGSLSDTQLFLFDLLGDGILANDDTVGVLAVLPLGDTRLTSLTPGNYLLGISGFDFDPIDSTSQTIFQSFPYTTVYSPTTGRGPLAGWSGGSSSGTYTITLTGAKFVAVPEPATSALVCAAGGALAVFLRRRRAVPRLG